MLPMKTTLPFFSGAMFGGCDEMNDRVEAEMQLETQDDLRQARGSHSRRSKPWLRAM
jgi:hypothetical protein